MPISQHSSPVFTVTCGNPSCTGPTEGGPAWDEDSRTRYFDSVRDARDWAETDGWSTDVTTGVLCPPCAADAREQADHQEEIMAAIGYALGTDGDAS